jgi:hypothetical protein
MSGKEPDCTLTTPNVFCAGLHFWRHWRRPPLPIMSVSKGADTTAERWLLP